MPRYKRTLTTAKNRAEKSGKYYIRNVYEWVDPYPDVLGSKPGKMVYARLMLMQIPFYFQSDFKISLPLLGLFKTYRPDFYIPSLKLVIEVNGEYFHFKPDVMADDAFKYSLYMAMGYKVVAWYDFEIESNLDKLITRDTGLTTYTGRRGGRMLLGTEKNIDDLAGLRKANQSKRKPYSYFVGAKKSNYRKGLRSYATK